MEESRYNHVCSGWCIVDWWALFDNGSQIRVILCGRSVVLYIYKRNVHYYDIGRGTACIIARIRWDRASGVPRGVPQFGGSYIYIILG